jgi:uncharacterized protein
MKIVALTDLHGFAELSNASAELLRNADVVLISGDLTHFGSRTDAAHIIDTFRTHNPCVLAVPGNCDPPDVGAWLTEEGISLDGCHTVVDGVAFAGVGGSLPCPNRTPNEYSEAELAAVLGQSVAGLDPSLPLVLVSHQPPMDTAMDVVGGGRHVGSVSVRSFIEQRRPLICFTGHIHESAGLDMLGPTQLVNPGPLDTGGCATVETAARPPLRIQFHS